MCCGMRAKRVNVELRQHIRNKELELIIRDDGIGFNVSQPDGVETCRYGLHSAR